MAKKKIYAVKKGKKTGLFFSWEECKEVVSGYPGAQYRGFVTEEEAVRYLTGTLNQIEAEDQCLTETSNQTEAGERCLSGIPKETEELEFLCGELLPGQIIAYVDGSYDQSIGRYSFGCVLITPQRQIIREFGNGDNPDTLALRNVAGEMLGAMFAVQWCAKNGYSAIDIRYDYLGIEMWVTGAWKTKQELTKKYADFMRKKARTIQISFQKVAAHTGDYYNEEADRLAKKGLTQARGIPEV